MADGPGAVAGKVEQTDEVALQVFLQGVEGQGLLQGVEGGGKIIFGFV
jgi:hypothetical protein